jgi:hypothetical protein
MYMTPYRRIQVERFEPESGLVSLPSILIPPLICMPLVLLTLQSPPADAESKGKKIGKQTNSQKKGK